MTDPLTDPRVIAARSRVRAVERTPERFADVTAEATTAAGTAQMRIYGRIDSDGAPWGISAQDVASALDALPDGTDRLDVHVHSRGGDAFEGLAILNLLRQAKPEVHVTVDGLAASAASAIAMAGKTITMAPSSQLMVHDASGIGVGQASDMRILADALDSISQSYAAAYASRAGGTADEWRAAMVPETWYRSDEAVKAGLADSVIKTPKAAAPTASFDLSIFAYAGRDDAPEPFMPARAPETPAEPPVTPSTEHKEADAMSDDLTKGLRERFGFAEDADTATILAAVDTSRDPQLTHEAIGKAFGITADAAKAAIDGAKAGKVTVSQSFLDTLEANAKLGAEARAKQLADERDEAIQAKVAAGIIGRDQVESWQRDWDRDPASAKAELDKLTVARFPVAPVQGQMGGETDALTYTDEMAAEDAEFFGLSKEAFAR